MKAALNISATKALKLKREAVRRKQAMSGLVESPLGAVVKPVPRKAPLRPLPTFSGGGLKVNVANNDALYSVMEE